MKTSDSSAAALVAITLLCLAFSAPATTVFWTGPSFTFNHASFTTNADALTTNHVGTDISNNVWLTRGDSQPLYNAAAENGWNGSGPSHTLWVHVTNTNAFPLSRANTNTLHYDIFANVVGHPGSSPRGNVNQTFYVHILPDDIYLSLELTAWGNNNGGSFTYIRSTPAPPTPTVTITNPVSGALFLAPANVTIQAAAAESGGFITNVQFLVGTKVLANVAAAPFFATTNNLAAGNYTLTAIASDSAGLTATNAVNITVKATPTVTITNPISGTLFVAPANVTIQAAASESGGSVTNVQFLVGTKLLANVAAAPFSATTNNLAAGNYMLTAIASDSAGLTATNAIAITVDTPPSVTVTNPVNNAVLAAPANLTIRASASDSDGTVTNVQILIGPTVLTNVTTSPYVAVTNGLGAGGYTITAVAFDNHGVENTNSISISVVTPVAVALANAAPFASTNFQFSYAANVGLSYVVQFTTNLNPPNWISLATNVAASNPAVFVDTGATNRGGFYRVGRLPNP